MANDESSTPDPHERYLELAEKRVRGEASPTELSELQQHLVECEQCRAYAAETQQEQDIMDAAVDAVQQNCDFRRIEQAIANRRELDRFQPPIYLALIIGFGVAGGVSWWHGAAEGAVTAFLAFAGFMALYWLYRRRVMERWSDLAAQCRKGDPVAFETFHRSAWWQPVWQRIAVAALFVWMAVFAVVWLGQGRWLMGLWAAVTAVAVVAFMWWGYRRSTRKREEAFITGEIDSDEYFLGNHAQRRALRLMRFLKRFTGGPGER